MNRVPEVIDPGLEFTVFLREQDEASPKSGFGGPLIATPP
jgi:hypothetical protein